MFFRPWCLRRGQERRDRQDGDRENTHQIVHVYSFHLIIVLKLGGTPALSLVDTVHLCRFLFAIFCPVGRAMQDRRIATLLYCYMATVLHTLSFILSLIRERSVRAIPH